MKPKVTLIIGNTEIQCQVLEITPPEFALGEKFRGTTEITSGKITCRILEGDYSILKSLLEQMPYAHPVKSKGDIK